MLDLEKSEFLSDAEIKEKAPCVFSRKASAEVSQSRSLGHYFLALTS